jgi:predicted nucleic acid-binding protein
VIAAFDASALILLLDEKANGPIDPRTGEPVQNCQGRFQHLVTKLSKTRGSRIIIPTPSLAEFLVRTTPLAAAAYISTLERLRGVRIAPFTVRAAIEFAELQREALDAEKRLKTSEKERRAKPKFDHQIVAIARVEGATVIYSEDVRLGKFAARAGMTMISVKDLPLPPVDAQGELPLEPPALSLPPSDED